jgi:hypothetical protein
MEEISITLLDTTSQMERLRSRRSTNRTLVSIHSPCFWRRWSWPRTQSLLTAQACHLRMKTTIPLVTSFVARKSKFMEETVSSMTVMSSLLSGTRPIWELHKSQSSFLSLDLM